MLISSSSMVKQMTNHCLELHWSAFGRLCTAAPPGWTILPHRYRWSNCNLGLFHCVCLLSFSRKQTTLHDAAYIAHVQVHDHSQLKRKVTRITFAIFNRARKVRMKWLRCTIGPVATAWKRRIRLPPHRLTLQYQHRLLFATCACPSWRWIIGAVWTQKHGSKAATMAPWTSTSPWLEIGVRWPLPKIPKKLEGRHQPRASFNTFGLWLSSRHGACDSVPAAVLSAQFNNAQQCVGLEIHP